MIGDYREPAMRRGLQLRALARYVTDDVYPYSAFYRPRLDAAGLGRSAPGDRILRGLPATSWEDVHDPTELVLRPDEKSIQRFASARLLAKVAWAKFQRRADRVNRDVIDPAYKPVRWVIADGVTIGYTDDDLERLAEEGRRWLALAGLGRYDVLVNLVPAGPDVGWWELVEGTRAAGLSALHLPGGVTPHQLAVVQPTVIAGRAADLERLLRDAPVDERASVHTLLVVDRPLDDVARAALADVAGPSVAIVGAWAPPGVRSLWVECRGGTAAHTSPDVELVEVVDGEVIWSGIGWKGSALLRLRTGVTGRVDGDPCPVCGRTSPRVVATGIVPAPPAPSSSVLSSAPSSFADVLDATPEVVGWQAELRRVNDADELIVHVAIDGGGHPGRVLRELDRQLHVTQFVVVSPEELEARLNETDYRRVLDER